MRSSLFEKMDKNEGKTIDFKESFITKINDLKTRITDIIDPNRFVLDKLKEEAKTLNITPIKVPPPSTLLREDHDSSLDFSLKEMAERIGGGTLFTMKERCYQDLIDALDEVATTGRLSEQSYKILTDCQALSGVSEIKVTNPMKDFFEQYLTHDKSLVLLFNDVLDKSLRTNKISRLIEDTTRLISALDTHHAHTTTSSSSSSSSSKDLVVPFVNVVSVLMKIEAGIPIKSQDLDILGDFSVSLKKEHVEERFGMKGQHVIRELDEMIRINKHLNKQI